MTSIVDSAIVANFQILNLVFVHECIMAGKTASLIVNTININYHSFLSIF